MEEIDAIIIDSLRNLECHFDEDITSLKHFDADMTVEAISRCLETIIPNSNFPKKLAPSMSAKLKICSSLAAQVRDLGFRDDVGYQTILYCNEAEIRRVLMFLIERIPRETSKVAHAEQTGYVPSLVKKIEQRVREDLQRSWVPSCVLQSNNWHPLSLKRLQVPCSSKSSEDFKDYWIHNVPVVTKQCTSKELIPSLLFEDSLISAGDDLKKCFKLSSVKELTSLVHSVSLVQDSEPELVKSSEEIEFENKFQVHVEELKAKKEECKKLELTVSSLKQQKEDTSKTESEEKHVLQAMLSQVNLKSKTLTVLSKEENLQRLKNMIETSRNKLISLSQQWHQIQSPLLKEYKSLQDALSSKDLKHQQEQKKLRNVEETYRILNLDLQEKTQLEEQSRQKLAQINKGHTRSGYTRRILEIIGNIKKQDEEIQKILNDTRQVQKEIQSLTGQVDRSFTLADELIFRDAKSDETARKSYKLLAQLHDDCSNIIKAVTDLGSVERECRNLQEQIESETSKESAAKLERVNKDLQEMRKETEILLQQS